MNQRISFPVVIVLVLAMGMPPLFPQGAVAQADNPGPPAETVKLIFIHHSTGENWLADGHGGLGKALGRNNYFVSDTNYGWGPDGIGDRTDILDWPEWFTGPNSARYLKAVYSEKGKRSPYSRTLPDPGGENQIVMFKSCFPNSSLEGAPTDPPLRGEGLTVGNAKAIYNELLTYFASRPDKLFIAITAPPLQERTHAENARAFNNWLVKEWLANYRGNNVGVFDLYNVLTGPENHHRYIGGKIEHVVQPGRNTLYYPTNGDDHPSPAGCRKATAEFVPLLNVYYHRWKAAMGSAAAVPQTPMAKTKADTPSMATPASEPEHTALHPPVDVQPRDQRAVHPSKGHGIIDDFEGEIQPWAAFLDEGKKTTLSFERDDTRRQQGAASLRISFDVARESWATCALIYQGPQDWQGARGLSLYVHTERVGQPVVVVAHQGRSPDRLFPFEFRTETTEAAVKGWQRIEILWEQFIQPPWEGDGKAKFDPRWAMGVALAFEGGDTGRRRGHLWVDAISLLPR